MPNDGEIVANAAAPAVPASNEELFKLGNECMAQRRYAEAEQYYLRLLDQKPDCYEAHLNLGNTFFSRKRREKALTHYREASRINPQCAEARFNAGNTLCCDDLFEEALREYEEALRIKPGYVDAKIALAAAMARLGRKEEAVKRYEEVLSSKPDSPSALAQLARIHLEEGRFDQAERLYRRFLEVCPETPDGFLRLGEVYQSQKKYKEAVVAFRQALALKPDFSPALSRLGSALLGLDRVDEAIASFNRALALGSDEYEALNNIGNAYFAKRDPDSGVEYMGRAVHIREEEAMAHWNRSLLDLLRGDYVRGWEGFEWRLKGKDRPLRSSTKPYWDGSDPKGKKILVYLEQGFGDCLHCVRYVPLLAERGAKVLLEYRDNLQRLFKCLEGESVTLVSERDSLIEYDLQVAVMSLPHLMGTTLENVPNKVPYLYPPADRYARYNLGVRTRPRVGFLWKGNPRQGGDRMRSGRLEYLIPILDLPDLEFVCLQQVLNDEERALLTKMPHVRTFPHGFGDFADTATVMDQLDLVLAVDTGVAHLAGAMGKTLWVALSHNSSWQWLLDREDSPWYPTARLFRQAKLHDWPELYERIRKNLKEHFGLEKLPEQYGEDEQVELAHRYLEVGNLPAAERICARFSPQQPEFPEALRALALVERNRGNLGGAVRHLTEAIAIAPSNDVLQNQLGEAYEETGRCDLALRSYQRAVEINPRSFRALANLAALHLAEGRYKEAGSFARRSIKHDPNNDKAILVQVRALQAQGRINQALKLLGALPTLTNKNIETHFELARLLSLKGRTEEASDACERILKLKGDCVEAHLLLGEQLERRGRFEDAVASYRRAIDIRPGFVEARSGLARMLLRHGKFTEGISSFYQALMLEPSNAALHLEFANACADHSRHKEAFLGYFSAVKLDPGRTEAQAGLKLARQKLTDIQPAAEEGNPV